ncbi:MAG: NAD-dependent epimerase/dehydratase family protein [Alphaproteobacteria bacterium]|nr:NAD-dependent epimerase/dehydratase family protein [Alphaproteobacteria bacterium]
MKVLILGGAGFFGSHVVDKFLEKGWDVIVLDTLSMGNKLSGEAQRKVEFVEKNAEDTKLVKQLAKKATGIVNFASVVGVDIVTENELKQMDNEVNIIKATVDASLSYNKLPIIYTSSSSVYGSMNQGHAANEGMPIAGSSSYSIAKAWGEKYYKCFSEKEDVYISVVRPFNLYGPRQDTRMVIPRFIEAAMTGKNLCVYGDGTQTRDFTYVEDGSEAIYQLFTSAIEGKYRLYQELNCCTGQETTISNLASIITDLVKSQKSQIAYEELPPTRKDYEVNRRFGDNSLFKQLTNIKELTSLQEGLIKCISFWQSQIQTSNYSLVG